MLWLVIKGASHQITGCNLFWNGKNEKWEVWIEKPNGKTLKIKESADEKEANEIKEAIDYAISKGVPSLELA
jgi:hypothetical protein